MSPLRGRNVNVVLIGIATVIASSLGLSLLSALAHFRITRAKAEQRGLRNPLTSTSFNELDGLFQQLPSSIPLDFRSTGCRHGEKWRRLVLSRTPPVLSTLALPSNFEEPPQIFRSKSSISECYFLPGCPPLHSALSAKLHFTRRPRSANVFGLPPARQAV